LGGTGATSGTTLVVIRPVSELLLTT
jgi:hypothetical protein